MILNFLRDLKEDETEKIRRRDMTRAVLFTVGGVALFFSIVSGILFIFRLVPYDTFLLYCFLVFISAIALLLAKSGFLRLAGYLFPLAIFAIAVYGNYLGGIGAPAILMYILTFTMIGMLHGYRHMFIVFIICLAAFSLFAFLFYTGHLVRIRDPEVFFVNRVVIILSSLSAIGLMTWIIGIRYRLEISERIKAEKRVTVQNKELKSMIEQLKDANDRIKESKNKFFKIFHLSPVPMTLNSISTGEYIEVNAAMTNTSGFSREEMLGKTPFSLGLFKRAEIIRFVKIIGENGRLRNHEAVVFNKDGTEKTALMNAEVTDIGETKLIITSAVDITDKKAAEEKLIKSQRLESLGLIAGGLAHDFNNILMGIMGNLSLLRLDEHIKGESDEYLVNSIHACERAQGLTRQLLTFSKGGAPIKLVKDIVPVLKREVQFNLSGSRIKPVYDFKEDSIPVEIDESQIAQVVNNLVLNAVQAMPPGGVITVTLEQKTVSGKDSFHASLESPAPGNYVIFSVSDNGSGIDDETIRRIFDPYFTTRENGTGLGLSVVYSIVKNHGGYIDVKSRPGAGSTFSVYLPSYKAEEVTTSKAEPVYRESFDEGRADIKSQKQAVSSGEIEKKILVMDDEDAILTVMRGMLRHLGYHTETAKTGAEAVEKFKESIDRRSPFDAVILDLTIPGGYGGREVIGAMKSLNPSVKAIVASGYSEDPVFSDYATYGFSGLLKKPFTINELGSVLSEIIDNK